MLLLGSFLHRQRLAEIITRWMINQPRVGDVRTLKWIVNFNSYLVRVWLDEFARSVLHNVHGVVPTRVRMSTTGQVKDFAVEHPTYTNARIEQMRERYVKFPEDFYRETPIDGGYWLVPVGEAPHLVGCTRIKRFRRIAEKGSRRIVEFMLQRIRANADALAEQRARDRGIAKSQLLTPPEEQAAEFAHAERRVLKSIKRGTIRSELPNSEIPDVAGLKIIVEPSERTRVLDAIVAANTCTILETEDHRGTYNATNLRVAYRVPREMLTRCVPQGEYARVLTSRGIDPNTLDTDYRQFLETGEERVNLEVIVSSFQEYLEAEIGRAMHEERVLAQRSNRQYNAHLATNVRYLMDYIFALCRAPGTFELEDVPIKLWVRYMPDTMERLDRQLLDGHAPFFDTIATPPTASCTNT
jgi:malate synthase